MSNKPSKSKYRIAVFSWESLHSVSIGGLAPAVTHLCRALAKKGHEIHLFTQRAPDQPDYDLIDGVHYHRVSFDHGHNIVDFAHNMSWAMVERFHATESIVGKFDVIHGHDWLVVNVIHDLKNKGYPTVLTFHSTEYGRNGGEFGDWYEYREISGKEWYGAYIADSIVTTSRAMREELMRLYGVPEWKVEIIPNGGYIRRFKRKIDPGLVKGRYGINPLAPLILFVGRMVQQKGPDILLEAIPHVLRHRNDAQFLFIGQGGLKKPLEKRANDLGITDSVTFLGRVSDDGYIDTLNACDIVCIPSRNEPFGLVLFEAWAAEKAVVVSDVGGLGENVENFVNGIKVFTYPESVAWGINHIINDPVGVRQLGFNGKEKLKKLGWHKPASQYVKVYRKLLKAVRKKHAKT